MVANSTAHFYMTYNGTVSTISGLIKDCAGGYSKADGNALLNIYMGIEGRRTSGIGCTNLCDCR